MCASLCLSLVYRTAAAASAPEWLNAVAGAVAGDALAVRKFLAVKENDREQFLTDADVDAVNTMLKERLGGGHDCSKLTMGATLLQVRGQLGATVPTHRANRGGRMASARVHSGSARLVGSDAFCHVATPC